MKRVIPFAIALVIILAFWVKAPAQGGGQEWLTDVDQAIAQAKEQKKDLLLDFTGSDWCTVCLRLKEEVFGRPEFKTAKDDFVLVELDFPRDKSKISAATQKQNDALQFKHAVEGFPTIILADGQGRPYAMTGYLPGGVGPYLAHLAELRRIREIRDKAFAAAQEAQGPARAEHLHKALSAMHGEFVIPNYREEVEQIIALDAQNKAGLQEKYRFLLAESDAYVKAMEIARRADKLLEEEKRDEVVTLLEEELKKAGEDALVRHKIQILRLNSLPLGKLPDAAAVFDELLSSPYTDYADKINLGVQRAYWLADADQLDEAAQQFEASIAQAEDVELKARLFYMKADMLETNDKLADAIPAYEQMIELSEKGGETWMYGQKRLGDLLVALGRPQEAIALYDRVLNEAEPELPIKINILSAKAAAQLAGGNQEAAVETARAAKSLLAAANVGEVNDIWLGEAEQRIAKVLKAAAPMSVL